MVPKFISMLQPRGAGSLKNPTLRPYFGHTRSESLSGVQASAVLKLPRWFQCAENWGTISLWSLCLIKYGPWTSSNGLPGQLLERRVSGPPTCEVRISFSQEYHIGYIHIKKRDTGFHSRVAAPSIQHSCALFCLRNAEACAEKQERRSEITAS